MVSQHPNSFKTRRTLSIGARSYEYFSLAVAAKAGLTLTQFALAWVLRQPNVAAAIAGASRPEQVDDNAAAAGVEVAPELFTEAEALLPG